MLTPEQELRIAKLCRLRWNLSNKALGARYGVRPSTITAIYNRTLRLPKS